MDQETLMILVVVGYVLGIVAAVGWPYLNSKLKNPELSFDWNYATWQVIGGVIGFIPTIIAAGKAAEFEGFVAQGWMGILLAVFAGYGAARSGREVQRTNEARLARKNGGV